MPDEQTQQEKHQRELGSKWRHVVVQKPKMCGMFQNSMPLADRERDCTEVGRCEKERGKGGAERPVRAECCLCERSVAAHRPSSQAAVQTN